MGAGVTLVPGAKPTFRPLPDVARAHCRGCVVALPKAGFRAQGTRPPASTQAEAQV